MSHSKRILFIGNSHTYFNDMPFIFQTFTHSEKAGSQGIDPAFCTMIVHGGRLLSEHLAEPEVHYNIKYGHYDHVVIQQAAHPFPGKEVLLRDGKILADLIHSAGSQMVGYMTWAEQAHLEHQQIMKESYTELCTVTDSILAPVGAVWKTVLQDQNAPVHLYYKDGEHASFAGSYLAACVIYAAIYGKTPVGLPHVFRHGENTVYELEREQALYLQKMTERYLFSGKQECVCPN